MIHCTDTLNNSAQQLNPRACGIRGSDARMHCDIKHSIACITNTNDEAMTWRGMMVPKCGPTG
eukprot:CAMPEP_0206304920 /NCGR_PEP_ID=MMETSP0106_2-20121207/9995_1 /ASSEMBLY_ACC=CAM_ASM_000206 /TAXON_ID=81532 /ORGANISM="Acanthoeca-like sp., Strain 10tr" /LENGTH=62 /DNA_ID=CAMNT_0053735749 /DNA_START=17 /DNA_END=205 /DNA_ORIENTATION=+